MTTYFDPGAIPMREREPFVFLKRGHLDVLDGAFVLVDKEGIRTQVPIGGIATIFLEPGTRVSHAAARLAARVGCLLAWVGEAGVRLYASGQPGGARSDRLLRQARAALDPERRRRVVHHMYTLRFDEEPDPSLTPDQLRGMEGVRVRELYKLFAQRYGVNWKGRRYDPNAWDDADLPNRCLSVATSCLYGITEAAVLAAGYSPAIGFLHTGKPLSFVYDISDIVKFESVVPIAFEVAGEAPNSEQVESRVRHACRDVFRSTKVLGRIIPLVGEVISAGGTDPLTPQPEAAGPAFQDGEGLGDAGHRY